jgi:hypothetical protein
MAVRQSGDFDIGILGNNMSAAQKELEWDANNV